ncbi:hypothetical protein [Cellulomonas olei]|uniref:hypothetical protein n=1 Tax=Cellulomonas sp. P4 TaxID=3142533 RepID=UPI0031B9FD24
MSPSGSGDLVRRDHALVRAGGVARSTATVAFDGRSLRWGDLPAATRRAARHSSPVVADGAVADAGLYRKADGSLAQVIRGWRAHRDRLYVAVAIRPVRVDGHQVRETGPWEPAGLRRWDAAGPPRRRVGAVPASAVPPATRAGGPHAPGNTAGPVPSTAPWHSAAAHAWGYLPPAVRSGAERAVPVPEDWLGELVQQSVGRKPFAQTLTVLRRDDEHAVVIRAERELPALARGTAEERTVRLAATDWQVEQVVLATTQPQRLEASREMPSWMS